MPYDKYQKPIGYGGLWVRKTKTDETMLSGEATFSYNGSQITVNFIGFANKKMEGKRPNYNLIVQDAKPSKPREVKPPQKAQETEL